MLRLTVFFFAGFGVGLVTFAAYTVLNDYYVKDRVLGEGILGSTMCVGIVVFNVVLQKLVDEFEWQVIYYT